jgi:hypothetical protein
MNKLFILSPFPLVLCISTAAFAHGAGPSMHDASISGGAFGSRAAAPGTNSLGTALPSSSGRGHRMKGPALGTGNPAVDREDAKVGKMVSRSARDARRKCWRSHRPTTSPASEDAGTSRRTRPRR